MRAAIAGASGYAGGELLRLLLGHPELEIGALTAAASAGSALGAHQPHLPPLADRILQETTAEALAGHDVVFLALPHGQSAAVAEQLGEDTLVVDCGADFRLADPAAWEEFYGGEHAGTWPYGLPELPGQRGRAARRHAASRCRAATRPPSRSRCCPPSRAGLAEPEVVVVAASGTSRRRPVAQDRTCSAARSWARSAPTASAASHRHTPEMEQNLSAGRGRRRSGVVHPDAGPDEPRHPRHLHGQGRARRHAGSRCGTPTRRH